jgi:hypothetical protein
MVVVNVTIISLLFSFIWEEMVLATLLHILILEEVGFAVMTAK